MHGAISRSDAGQELGRVKRAVVRDLRQAMRRKHLNQAALARRIGITRAAITRLLDEEDLSLSVKLLGRLAAALDARVDLQLAGKPSTPRRHS